MLFHNENEADGIQNVMKSLHKYVPYHGDNCDRVYGSQGVVADQLSVERGVNALLEVSKWVYTGREDGGPTPGNC